MKRISTISFPKKDYERVAILRVSGNSPYEMIEQLRDRWKAKLSEAKSHYSQYPISKVLPIHNASGIRDKRQVTQMQQGVKQGQHILEADHLPNIKLVVAPDRRLLLFDGHHSLLAYFSHGKEYLGEVPFVLLSGESNKPVTSAEIAYFFPPVSRDAVSRNWQNYTVNWQAPKGRELEARQVSSTQELALQLSKRDKGAVEE